MSEKGLSKSEMHEERVPREKNNGRARSVAKLSPSYSLLYDPPRLLSPFLLQVYEDLSHESVGILGVGAAVGDMHRLVAEGGGVRRKGGIGDVQEGVL